MSAPTASARAMPRLLGVLGRALALAAVGVAELVAIVFSPLGYAERIEQSGPAVLLTLGAMLVGLGMLAALAWRDRAPASITVGAAALSLLVPIGPVPAMVALASAIRGARGWRLWASAAAAIIAVTAAVVRDVLAPARDASVLQLLAAPRGSTREDFVAVPVWLAIAAGVLPLAIAAVVGMLGRSQRRQHAAEARSEAIGGALARSEERTRIAREIHDVLGHRLSLLSLQAGALEAQAARYPELAPSIEAIRVQASKSMDDLRVILDVVGAEEGAPQLANLADIVEDWASADQPVSAAIFLESAESAPPELSRAVVRIVQEALTNARRHAPRAPILLRVVGGPATGVTVTVRNRVGQGEAPVGAGGGGLGLVGMEERVRALGGVFDAGLRGGDFVVEAQLPWSAHRP